MPDEADELDAEIRAAEREARRDALAENTVSARVAAQIRALTEGVRRAGVTTQELSQAISRIQMAEAVDVANEAMGESVAPLGESVAPLDAADALASNRHLLPLEDGDPDWHIHVDRPQSESEAAGDSNMVDPNNIVPPPPLILPSGRTLPSPPWADPDFEVLDEDDPTHSESRSEASSQEPSLSRAEGGRVDESSFVGRFLPLNLMDVDASSVYIPPPIRVGDFVWLRAHVGIYPLPYCLICVEGLRVALLDLNHREVVAGPELLYREDAQHDGPFRWREARGCMTGYVLENSDINSLFVHTYRGGAGVDIRQAGLHLPFEAYWYIPTWAERKAQKYVDYLRNAKPLTLVASESKTETNPMQNRLSEL